MEREKRQTKPPEGYIIPPVCFPRIRKKKPKAKKVHEASYQVIPVPMKFTSLASFYALYADVGLRTYQGTLNTDSGVLNQYLDFRGVEIIKNQNLHTINITFGKKAQVQLPSWQHLVEGLLESESNELRDWGTRIKNFSLEHEEAYRVLASNKVIINGMNEGELLAMTVETERRMSWLLQHYPCLIFTSVTEKNSSRLEEACFNESYISSIGYSLDSFASTVLQEGLPRIMPNNTAYAAKLLIENYYALGKEGVETPEIISELLMKNGYLRRVRYKIIYYPTYKNGAYHVSAVVVLLEKQNSAIKEQSEEVCEINKKFLKKIIRKEKDINKFLQKYYDTTLELPYTNSHKICKIRELNNEESKGEDWFF